MSSRDSAIPDVVRKSDLTRLADGLHDRVRTIWIDRFFGPGAEVEQLDELVGALRIRDRQGNLTYLHANAAQQQYAKTRRGRNIILKSRQLGITTYIAARFFLSTILSPGTVTLQVAHSQEAAQQIFRIVHRFFNHLGPRMRRWLAPGIVNVRELAFERLDSRYLVDTAGNRNVSRGLTIHNLHASEVAMWPGDPQETMASLVAAVPPNGAVDIESTPNGAGGYFYSEWQRAQSGSEYQPHFFPWWIERGYRLPLIIGEPVQPFTDAERELIARHGLEKEQILYRRQLFARLGKRAAQEFAENEVECFLRSGRPVFDVEILEARLQQVGEAPKSELNGALQVWFEPQRNRHFILGADVAEGLSKGDYSAAEIIDVETGLQCAEIQAQWPVQYFAERVAELGRRYNHALLAVERNNLGHAVLNVLQHQLGYEPIYRHWDDADKMMKVGWPTTLKTKPQAIGMLDNMIRTVSSAFVSRRLLTECRGFQFGENGEMAARSGSHDDLVIAMAIAQAVRARGGALQCASLAR